MIRKLFRNRKYKSGTGWCFWRWTDVDSEYITRLHVLKTPWFAICLHWINKPDPEPYLHDHPVSFLSIILRGGYSEARQRPGDREAWNVTHRWYNWIRAKSNDRHTITHVRPNTVTLCFMGKKTREWGFHKPHGQMSMLAGSPRVFEWIYWKDYYAAKRNGVQL